MIFAGDIGATKCNLALFERQNGKLHRLAQRRFLCRDYQGIDQIVSEFLSGSSQTRPTAAAFGVAGPVVDNQARFTNRPWIVDGHALASQLALPHVNLFNDLETTGYGLQHLEPEDFFVLNRGTPAPTANQIVLAAGTGLGEAVLFWDGYKHRVSATEGGHSDFIARNETEIDLLRFLKQRFSGPVGQEMILSGRGFRLLHEFLDPAITHPSFAATHGPDDAAEEITRNALDAKCPVCVRALDLWVSLYGSEGGNMALRTLARGGVYVAGGIAPKILAKLKDGAFLEAFCDKWRFRAMLSQIPIHVILNEDCPLIGAALLATYQASSS
jgi:glucokinase